MLLFNRQLNAQEAYDAGLVAQVFPKATFWAEVQKRIDEFVDNPINVSCLMVNNINKKCQRFGKPDLPDSDNIAFHFWVSKGVEWVEFDQFLVVKNDRK